MAQTIRIGIVGYGNLGKGAEASIQQQSDMELAAVFTRRDPETLKINHSTAAVAHLDEVQNYQDDIDVMLMCGGSATDLPEQVPAMAKMFNTVDSYDTHAKIPEFYDAVEEAAKASGKTSVISVGWDPGLFSLNRVMAQAVLPVGHTYSFWGKGLSQGHSDAVRRVDGVKDGVQYTIPSEQAMKKVRDGENPELSKSERHKRDCYVVAEVGADQAKVEEEIKTMPNYFDEYETTVTFITEAELKQNHADMPHGGFVIHSGDTGNGNNHIYEFSLDLSSNPEFTSSVLVAYGRAAYHLNQEGQAGAKTVYDIAPGYISPKSAAALRRDEL